MTMRLRTACTALTMAIAATTLAALSPDVERRLAEAKYVYLQSERKTGEWGKAAEIWFYVEKGDVYVGTRPTSWRVRRIKAGRKRARIAVGAPDGPTFEATGSVAADAGVEQRMMEHFARKYPDGWPRHADSFRQGFKTGERVLVRYTPR
jgi:hypothetical protein